MLPDAILERVCRFAASLIPRGSRVLVAVSGGSDSVALLWLLLELRGRFGIDRPAIVHVNHGLRGRESDEDEAFVRELAGSLGLACHVVQLRGKTAESSGIEAWAREQRYAAFARLCAAEGYDLVATGHTADDQFETLVMRLMRGSGLRGLAGIRMRRADGVIRPLLTVRRSALLRYLADNGRQYRTDPSNADQRFLRNRIRHSVLPALERAFPECVPAAAEGAIGLQYLLDALQPAVNNWVDSNVLRIDNGVAFRKEATVDTALGREALSECLRRIGVSLSRYHVEQIVGLWSRSEGTVLLPAGWRAEAFRERVTVTLGTSEAIPFSCPLVVPGTTHCGPRGRFRSEILAHGETRAEPYGGDKSVATLDLERCGLPLVYRSARGDDRFEPFGAPGFRPLLSWLKKQGIGRDRRRTLGVVADSEGQVIWVPGLRIAHGCRLTARTRRVLRLRYESPLLY
ncbi:MAG: tRNA lysidine(34) synthetase TilS [Chitinivibrionales bacterium]|nr:tRNA lysidine(34) synthetase TilS [Chitinivibrionales bacterium]